MVVHFNLRQNLVDNKKTSSAASKLMRTIHLDIRYNGKRCRFSSGLLVKVSNWDKSKERAKSNSSTVVTRQERDNDPSIVLNRRLLAVREKVDELYALAKAKSEIIPPEVLKKKLLHFIENYGKEEEKQTLFAFIDDLSSGKIKIGNSVKSDETLKVYKSVKNHLIAFADYKNLEEISFNDVTVDFCSQFIDFLSTKYKRNTIAKDIKVLKAFMNKAFEMELHSNEGYKSRRFAFSPEEVDGVALSWAEIEKLYRTDMSSDSTLDQCKDLFVFGCYIGQRFSDFSKVKRDNIIYENGRPFISLNTQKTKEHVKIPCSPIVIEIFQKYKNNQNSLPKSYSLKLTNENIKRACKLAGLNQLGRFDSEPSKPLWDCISTKTARRSFATNWYQSGNKKVTPYIIMKFTGHKSEKSFFAYIKINKKEALDVMIEAMDNESLKYEKTNNK